MKHSTIVLCIVAVFGSTLSTVKGSRVMQVIKQNWSSSEDIRLTCHSLDTFILILQANLKKDESGDALNLRLWFNRRCAGQQHCRVNLTEDNATWNAANVYIEYACIADLLVHRYCNMKIMIADGETGYIKSPGYPLYYTDSCHWTFQAAVPSQRISLNFHDLNIRNPTPNGHCIDLVRIRDDDSKQTLYQSCGTQAGIEIHSQSKKITLHLISTSKISTFRGFFLQYKAVGCPRVNLKTIECRAGYVYPDSRQSTRILGCDEHQGRWNESIETIPQCVHASSAAILKADRNRLVSLSDNSATMSSGDSTSSMMQGSNNDGTNYSRDVVVPLVLIAMLMFGNAVIVYMIFKYKKRKLPTLGGKPSDELALSSSPSSSLPSPPPQV